MHLVVIVLNSLNLKQLFYPSLPPPPARHLLLEHSRSVIFGMSHILDLIDRFIVFSYIIPPSSIFAEA